VIRRGSIYWADLGEPAGSRPAHRRPVVVVQSHSFNASRLNTVVVAVVTSNTALATVPGNVFLPGVASGLPRDSVVNVSALVTLNKADLVEPTGQMPEELMRRVDRGLRRVLGLR
jgi:mRNA interferase MazF